MKEKLKQDLNLFFVECFNAILRQEEGALEKACQGELSVKEMHLLEAIDLKQKLCQNTSTGVASHLGITLGSLTVAARVLEQKGFIDKVRDEEDKRVAYLFLTEKGKRINSFHERFHTKMIEEVLNLLDEKEGEILISSLIKLKNYFKEGVNTMVKIITDSSSEFLSAQQQKYDVRVLPMPINFESQTYMSGVDITDEEFYAKLAASPTLPTTSMVNSHTFKKAFEEEISKGNDVVAITISSELSVTYSQALAAAQEVDEKRIFVVDSKNASLGQHALVAEATKLRDEGLTAEEIFVSLNALKEKIRLHAMIDTLKYLRAGGRLSGSAAVVGTLLQVKPMVVVEDGKVINKGKAVGKFNAFRYIINSVRKDDIDFSKAFVLAHGCNEKVAKEFEELFAKETGIEITERALVGATIGTHAGPGTVAVAYFVK